MQIAYIDLHEELRALNAPQDALAAVSLWFYPSEETDGVFESEFYIVRFETVGYAGGVHYSDGSTHISDLITATQAFNGLAQAAEFNYQNELRRVAREQTEES